MYYHPYSIKTIWFYLSRSTMLCCNHYPAARACVHIVCQCMTTSLKYPVCRVINTFCLNNVSSSYTQCMTHSYDFVYINIIILLSCPWCTVIHTRQTRGIVLTGNCPRTYQHTPGITFRDHRCSSIVSYCINEKTCVCAISLFTLA